MVHPTPALFNALRLAGVIGSGTNIEPQSITIAVGYTGLVLTLVAVLPGSLGFTRVSGAATVATDGRVIITTGLASGTQAVIVVRETSSNGVAVEFPVTIVADGAVVPSPGTETFNFGVGSALAFAA